MKKHLLSAAIGLLCLSAAPTALADEVPVPVFSLENNGLYFIYDNNTSNSRNVFYYETDPTNQSGSAVYGTHITPESVTEPMESKYVWVAELSNDGTWTFKNLASNNYMPKATGNVSTTADENARGYFDVETTSFSATFKVKVNGTNNVRWDCNDGPNYNVVNYGGNGHPIRFYKAIANGDKYDFAEKEQAVNVTYTYPTFNGVTPSITLQLAPRLSASEYTPTRHFFNATGMSESNDIVSADNNAFTVTGAWNFPMVMNHVYRVHINPNNNSSKKLFYNGSKILTNHSEKTELVNENLFWYFKLQEFTSNGELKVTMHTIAEDDAKGVYLTSVDDSANQIDKTYGDTPTTFVIQNTTWGNRIDGDFCMKLDGSNIWTNNRNPRFSTWADTRAPGNDGSVMRLYSLTEDDFNTFAAGNSEEAINEAKANPTSEHIRTLLTNIRPEVTTLTSIFTNATAFINNGYASANGASTWNSYVESIDLANATDYTINEAIEKFRELVESSANITDNLYLQFNSPFVGGDNMVVRNDDYSLGRYGNDVGGNSKIWTLVPASGGFKLLNNFSYKYIKFPEGNNIAANTSLSLVETESQASTFCLTLIDAFAPSYGIKYTGSDASETINLIGQSSNTEGDSYKYLAAQSLSTEAPYYQAWNLIKSTEANANSEYTAGYNASYNKFLGSFGNGVGQYATTNASDAYKQAANAFAQLPHNAKKEQIRSALHRVREAYNNDYTASDLNMPVDGHFYRIANKNSSLLLSMNLTRKGNNDRHAFVDTDNAWEANTAETVFLYKDGKLISLKEGLALQNCDPNNYNKVLYNASTAGTFTFTEQEGTKGKFNIKSNTGRALYNADALKCIDAANSMGTADGYQWTLYDVAYLPIPSSTDGSTTVEFTTVNMPVSLAQRNGVDAYTITLADNRAVITKIEGNIPANTPALLHITGGDPNKDNHMIYLPVINEGYDANNNSYLTAPKGDTKYMVLSGTEFAELTAENKPAFEAAIECPAEITESPIAMRESTLHDVLTGVEGKVYTLRCNDSARGYVTHQNGQERLHATATHNNADATDPNYQWTLVKDGENVYLYNLGAEKFAAAYAKHDFQGEWPDKSYVEFDWHFSDYPTAVDIKFLGWDETMWLNDAILNIHGGQIGEGTTRPAGMMVIAVNANGKVPCIAGADHDRDGAGFQFTPVSDATVDVDALHAKIADAKAEMAEAHDKFAEVIADENNVNTVGYFDQTTMGAYNSNFTPAEADADAETKYYAYVRAKNSVAEPAYNEFAHSGKYNLMNKNGQYYRAAATKNADGTYTLFAEPAAIDGNDPTFNWLATVSEDGLVTLTHTFQAPADAVIKPRNAVHRAPAGFKDFPVNIVENEKPEYDGYGNITLPVEGKNVILRATTLADDAQTTAIREVEAANEGNAETIYDLQGRRLNRAARGINIINGKKVYIK